jgi:hypothetical protein
MLGPEPLLHAVSMQTPAYTFESTVVSTYATVAAVQSALGAEEHASDSASSMRSFCIHLTAYFGVRP